MQTTTLSRDPSAVNAAPTQIIPCDHLERLARIASLRAERRRFGPVDVAVVAGWDVPDLGGDDEDRLDVLAADLEWWDRFTASSEWWHDLATETVADRYGDSDGPLGEGLFDDEAFELDDEHPDDWAMDAREVAELDRMLRSHRSASMRIDPEEEARMWGFCR